MKRLKYTLPETKRRITIRKLREDLVYDANQYKKYSRLLREGRSDGKILTESQIHGQFINEIKKSIDEGWFDTLKQVGIKIKDAYTDAKEKGDEVAAKRNKKKYDDWVKQVEDKKAASKETDSEDRKTSESPKSVSDKKPTPTSVDGKPTDSKSASPATKLEDTKLTPEQATKAGAAVINLLPKEEQEKLKKMSPEQMEEFVKKNSAKLDTAGEKIADKISDTTVTSDNPKAKGFFGKMMTWAKENPMKATAALALITTIGVAASIGSGGLAPLIMHTLAASAIGAAKGGAVGALGGAAVDLYKQKTDPANTGKAIDWKRTAKAAVSGAKSGALGGGAMGGLTAVGGAAMQGVSGLMGQATGVGTAAASAAPGATSVADRALHAAGKGALRGAGMAGLGAGARDVYKQAKDPNNKGIDLRQTARAAGRGAVVGAVGGGLAGGAMSLAGDLSVGVRNLFTRGTGTVTSDELHKASRIAVDPNSPNHAQETALTHDAAVKAKSLDSIGLKTGGDVSNRADGGFDVTEKRTGYKYHFTKDGVPIDSKDASEYLDKTNAIINQQSPVTQDVKEKIFQKLGSVPNDNEIRQQPNGIVGVRDSSGATRYFYKATGNPLINASALERASAIDRFNNPGIDDQGRRDWLQKHGMVQPTTQPTTPQQPTVPTADAARQKWLDDTGYADGDARMRQHVNMHRAGTPHTNDGEVVTATPQQPTVPTAADTGNQQSSMARQPQSFVPNPQQTHAGEMAQAAQTTPVQQSPVAPPTDAAHMNVVDKLDARNAIRSRMALTPDETAAAQAAAQPAQNPVDVPTAADTQYAADQQAAAQYDASGNPVQQATPAQPAFVPANNGQPHAFVPNQQSVAAQPEQSPASRMLQMSPEQLADEEAQFAQDQAEQAELTKQIDNGFGMSSLKPPSTSHATPIQPTVVPNPVVDNHTVNPTTGLTGGEHPVDAQADHLNMMNSAIDKAKSGNPADIEAAKSAIKDFSETSYTNHGQKTQADVDLEDQIENAKTSGDVAKLADAAKKLTQMYTDLPQNIKETKLFTRSTSIPNMFRLS